MTVKRSLEETITAPQGSVLAKRAKTANRGGTGLSEADSFALYAPTSMVPTGALANDWSQYFGSDVSSPISIGDVDLAGFTEDALAGDMLATHDGVAADAPSYPFLELLSSGATGDSVGLPTTMSATTTTTANGCSSSSSPDVSSGSSPTSSAAVSGLAAGTKQNSFIDARSGRAARDSRVHSHITVSGPSSTFEAVSSPVTGPDSNNSEGNSTDDAADEAEVSRKQADRAARNRESSRRAREKAKNHLKTLENEVLVLREQCRRYRAHIEALMQHQSARAQPSMCGFQGVPSVDQLQGHHGFAHSAPEQLPASAPRF